MQPAHPRSSPAPTQLRYERPAKEHSLSEADQFRVGASLLSVDGVFFNGANVENASYPVTTCAERVAFGKAVTEGHRKIKAVAVATDISPPASPCGMCRQFIREFCDFKVPILMFDKDGNYVVMRLEESPHSSSVVSTPEPQKQFAPPTTYTKITLPFLPKTDSCGHYLVRHGVFHSSTESALKGVDLADQVVQSFRTYGSSSRPYIVRWPLRNDPIHNADAAVANTYFVALIATVGGMLFGFDISSIAAIVVTDQYIDYFNNPSGIIQGAIGSALAAGSVIGSLMAGPISDKFGRRDSIMFACFWWLIGTAVQVATNGVGSLIAGRVLNGVCVGITSSQVPVYLAEIAKRESRGRIIIIQQLAIEWGIFIMYFASYGAGFIPGPASFRTAWAFQFIPVIVLMVGLPFLPRSPRWLAKVGREEEAIQTLADIQAGGNRDDALVIAEWEEIYTVLVAERESVQGWRKFISNGMWKRTLAGMSVQAWQQLSGANVIVYYLTYVFLIAGLEGNINLIASGVQYALFIVFTSIMFFFIDRTGRRTLLIAGALGMGICHFVIGGVLGGFSEPVPGATF
ncbi:hypothetical protein NUW58_g9431 [Xylaria curta]|uniref:Uncharacterized protein n=1 Tax=Xylaria curta TaxID=42375 RepID=A0ACC1MWL1_9PEZI|nr:hypothetical protein NUW58_g9431 [Xylaria curta]